MARRLIAATAASVAPAGRCRSRRGGQQRESVNCNDFFDPARALLQRPETVVSAEVRRIGPALALSGKPFQLLPSGSPGPRDDVEPPRFLSGRGIKGEDYVTAGRSANGSDHDLAPGDQRPTGQAEAVFAIANRLIPNNLAVFDLERPNRPRQPHFHVAKHRKASSPLVDSCIEGSRDYRP